MTINELLEKIDKLRVNAFAPEDKATWINQLELTVQRDVMKLTEPTYYAYPEDADKELSLTGEWGELYILWLASMLDFWEQDMAKYNASANMYNAQLVAFKQQYRREHPIRSGFTNLM